MQRTLWRCTGKDQYIPAYVFLNSEHKLLINWLLTSIPARSDDVIKVLQSWTVNSPLIQLNKFVLSYSDVKWKITIYFINLWYCLHRHFCTISFNLYKSPDKNKTRSLTFNCPVLPLRRVRKQNFTANYVIFKFSKQRAWQCNFCTNRPMKFTNINHT